MSQPLLSILIPTLPERKHKLIELKYQLQWQKVDVTNGLDEWNKVEIIIDDSPSFLKGGPSIGKKREALVKRATGKYLCFLDDDDTISPDYLETILTLLTNQPAHVVTFRALYKLQTYWGVVNMSLQNKENEQATPERIIQRPPWHMCPVWSEFAKLYPFPDLNNAEDFAWMEKVLTHCQTEAHTDRILFQYNHGPHSEADKIPLPA